MCWIKEGCKTLAPKSCGSLPLDVVDYVEEFDGHLVNLRLNWGSLARNKVLDDELNNAPTSCNPPCFHIKKTALIFEYWAFYEKIERGTRGISI